MWQCTYIVMKNKINKGLEMSRSNFINNIIFLISDGVISFENQEEFSDELKLSEFLKLMK